MLLISVLLPFAPVFLAFAGFVFSGADPKAIDPEHLPSGLKAIAAVAVVLIASASAVAFFWGQAALFHALCFKDSGVFGAFGAAWKKTGSFLWVSLAVVFITTGGYLLFFIPGVVFSVWFAFSFFVLVKEGEKGMRALLKSREYVRGRWPQVFVRLFVVWLFSSLLSAVPFAGPFLFLAFLPFMTVFAYELFDELRAIGGKGVFSPGTWEKCKWPLAGAAGFVVCPLLVLFIIGMSLFAFLFCIFAAAISALGGGFAGG